MSDAARVASSITINGIFQRAFRIFADRVAVTSETSSLTYAELGRRSQRLAAALHALGVRKGDRVAVLSETRPEYVETYAALASLGATARVLVHAAISAIQSTLFHNVGLPEERQREILSNAARAILARD